MATADIAASGVVGANGSVTLTFKPPAKQTWTVTQVSISAPNVGGTSNCAVYRDGYLITPLVPQADAAAGDPPVILRPNSKLTVVWAAATVGAAVQALVIYDDGN